MDTLDLAFLGALVVLVAVVVTLVRLGAFRRAGLATEPWDAPSHAPVQGARAGAPAGRGRGAGRVWRWVLVAVFAAFAGGLAVDALPFRGAAEVSLVLDLVGAAGLLLVTLVNAVLWSTTLFPGSRARRYLLGPALVTVGWLAFVVLLSSELRFAPFFLALGWVAPVATVALAAGLLWLNLKALGRFRGGTGPRPRRAAAPDPQAASAPLPAEALPSPARAPGVSGASAAGGPAPTSSAGLDPVALAVTMAEREYPVAANRPLTPWRQAWAVLQWVIAAEIAMMLLAAVIAGIDARWDEFVFLAELLGAAVPALTVLIIGFLVLVNIALNLRHGNLALFRVTAAADVRLDCPPERASALCRDALARLPQGCALRPEAGDARTIVAKTAPSEESFGEVVTINLRGRDDGATDVAVSSRPWVDSTLFDWGANAANVRRLAADLRRLAGGSQSP